MENEKVNTVSGEPAGVPGRTDARGRLIPSGEGVNAEGQQVSVNNPQAEAVVEKAEDTNANAKTDEEIAAEQFDESTK